MAAFVDVMNRTGKEHISTVERERNIRHDRDRSFISQGEVCGNDADLLAAARAALREAPDVLAIEGGRPYGTMPMNDALVGRVHSGAVEARDA